MIVDMPLMAAIFVALLGIIFCGTGWWLQNHVRDYRRNGIHTTGIVTHVAYDRDDSRTGIRGYRPTLDVTGPDGGTVSCKTVLSSSSYDFAEGQELEVLHIPGRDTVLLVDSSAGAILPWALIGIGGIALTAGLLALTGVALPFGG